MTCDRALAERLIEITSKPLQNYSLKHIVTGRDPYYGYPDDEYSLRTFVWDISPRKRLVLNIKDDPTLAPNDQDVYKLGVVYHFRGIPFFRRALAHHTFPKSVLSTLCQFAYDGITEFAVRDKALAARYDAQRAQEACQQALRRLA
ncbi:predicted ORF [Xanthomonas phage XacN1]|nr:predicted ORF [Xanthomonas phage XacN1]